MVYGVLYLLNLPIIIQLTHADKMEISELCVCIFLFLASSVNRLTSYLFIIRLVFLFLVAPILFRSFVLYIH